MNEPRAKENQRVRLSLTMKIGLLIALPLAGSIVSSLLFARFLERTKTDGHVVDVAGRQRMLSAAMRDWVHMVAIGQEEDRAGLRERIAAFDENLAALERGGDVLGEPLAPPPAEVGAQLAAAAGLWRRLKPDLAALASLPRKDRRFQEAYRRAEPELENLRELSNQVVLAFAARSSRLRAEMLMALRVIAGLTGLVFLAGILITRLYIVRPVRRIGDVARRIGAGDFTQRLEVSTADELSSLAHAFNDMASQVQRLLAALDLSRKHAETIVASVPAGLLTLRGDLSVLRGNRSFLETFGVDEAELARRPSLMELLPAEGLMEAALEVLSTGRPKRGLQLNLPARDGSKRSLRIAIAATRLSEEEEKRLVVVVEDVSENERLNLAAVEMGRRYHEIMENATDGIVVMGRDGQISYINGAAERMFGYERSEVMGQTVSMLMPAQYREAHERGVRRYQQTDKSALIGRVIPLEGLRKGGETFPLEISLSSCRTGEGIVFTGILRDVTERRRTEEALRLIVEGTAEATGEDFFRLLAQNLAQALGVKVVLVTRLPGSPSGSARTLALWVGGSFSGNRDIPLAGTPCEKVLSGERYSCLKGLSRLFPKCTDLAGSGMESYAGIPLVDSQRQVIGHLAVMDDKPSDEGDERRGNILRIFGARAGAELDRIMAGESLAEKELELRQSLKLDAVGKLAGGIAHDFNNILTAILGCSSFLLQNLKPDDANRADVLTIESSAKRAAGLTSQILAFSRKQLLRPKRFDLNDAVEGMRDMLRRLISEDIELSIRLSDKPLLLQADLGQIEQVIMNLALNARDAVPKGGKIIIETLADELAQAHVHGHGRIPAGSYATLAVSDDGAGMSPEVQAHLFEPFFTTKETGKGTGLGLSTVYGIIAQSGGYITACSEAGRGSTFRIYLPKAGDRAEDGEPAPPKKEIPRGTGVVLLVEDEPAVRELARRILTQNDFTVIATGDPLEASSLCERHKETIRLLVTDMVMPKVNGLEVAQQVRAARPGTPVLFMSGYTERFDLPQNAGGQKGAFLQKPFAPSAFLEKIHELLGASQDGTQ